MDIVRTFPNVLVFRSSRVQKRLKVSLQSTAIHQYRNWLTLQVTWLYIKFYHRLFPSFSLATLSKVLDDLLNTCTSSAFAVRELLPWNMVGPFDTLTSLPQGFPTFVSFVHDIRNLTEEQQCTPSPIHTWGDATNEHVMSSINDLGMRQMQNHNHHQISHKLPVSSTSVAKLTLADILILLLVRAYTKNAIFPLHAIKATVMMDAKMSKEEWASVCMEAYLIATHALGGADAGTPTRTNSMQSVEIGVDIGANTGTCTKPIGMHLDMATVNRGNSADLATGTGMSADTGIGVGMSTGIGVGMGPETRALESMDKGVSVNRSVGMDKGGNVGASAGVAILDTICRKLWCPSTYRRSSRKTRDGILAYACNSGNVRLIRKLLHARADVHRCIDGGDKSGSSRGCGEANSDIHSGNDGTEGTSSSDSGGSSGGVGVLNGIAGEIHSGISDTGTGIVTARGNGTHSGNNTGIATGTSNGNGYGDNTTNILVPATAPVPVQVNTGRNNNNGNIRIYVHNPRTHNMSTPVETNRIKKPPIMLAMARNHVKVMRMLLEAQADVNGCDEEGETALIRAIKGECGTGILSLLIKHRANVDVIDKERNTPLEIAMTQKNYPAFDILVASGAKVNTKPGRWTLLMEAVVTEDVHIVSSLIQAKVSLDARNSDGANALMLAAIHSPAIVSLLLEGKANVNAYDEAGFTPLMYAVEAGKDDIVHILLNKKAKVDATGQDWTPLMIASHYGCSDIARILLDAGASLERRNYEGRNALMMAASRGHHAAVRVLGAQDTFYNTHTQR